MSIIKRGADLVYTFRFIRMLVLDWKEWDAYKQGVIDEKGKRIKKTLLDTDAKKSAYTPFIRLCANVKRLLSKVPGGSSRLGSFAAALYLIKENNGLGDDQIDKIMRESGGPDASAFLMESNEWFVCDDKQLSPGIYKIMESKVINSSFEELVNPKDKIRVHEESYPVGNVFGIDIYEATHLNTNQKIYITTSEIIK